MGGFPSRVSRRSLGPTRRNRAPVTDHELYFDAAYMNLMCWQVAGMNVCAPRAFAKISSTGTLLASGESWDPNGLLLPTPARTGAGLYTLTYAASYNDDTGNPVTLDLIAALPFPQGTAPKVTAIARVVDFHVVEIAVSNASNVATDADVFVWVF